MDKWTKKKRFFSIVLQIFYILDFLGVSRKKPRFDHKLWNIHDCVVGAVPRFNNLIEGWLNAFASCITIDHPDIVILAEKIRRAQSKFESGTPKVLQGYNVKTKKSLLSKIRRRYYSSSQCIRPISLHDFLKNIATNITL